MLGSAIERLLYSLSADIATEVFCWLIMIVLVVSLYGANKGKHSRFLQHAPSVMTSLGILGTFVGIVIGLLHFDVAAIDQSIRYLLNGMKTAFITSLVGMLASISFKLIDTWQFAPKRDASNVPDEVSPAHILASLERQNFALDTVVRSLSASEEGSVVGQLKMVRTDISDAASHQRRARETFEKELFAEMKGFADLLSKSATEVVIEALRQVIVDFNKNLVEQFGDNFKALDESVKKLVDWQAQYSVQVDEMGQQFQRSVDTIDSTRVAIERIGEDCQRIPGAMESLRDVLQVNQHQIQELQRHLEAFVQMRDRAVEAVPEIQRQVQGVAEQLGAAAVGMSEVLAEKSDEFANHVNSTNRAVIEMAHEVSSASGTLSKELTDSMKELESVTREMVRSLEQAGKEVHEQVSACTEEMAEAVRRDTGKALSGVEQQVKVAVERTGEAVNTQMSAMDKAVAQELERVFSHFGQSLTRISDAFTSDYQKLMQRLSDMSRAVA